VVETRLAMKLPLSSATGVPKLSVSAVPMQYEAGAELEGGHKKSSLVLADGCEINEGLGCNTVFSVNAEGKRTGIRPGQEGLVWKGEAALFEEHGGPDEEVDEDAEDDPNRGVGWFKDAKEDKGFHRLIVASIHGQASYHQDGYIIEQTRGKDRILCSILLLLDIPKGAYVDLEEMKHSHEYNVKGQVKVMAPPEVIDIEAPATSKKARHHTIALKYVTHALNSGLEFFVASAIRLPVHLRYPAPTEGGRPVETLLHPPVVYISTLDYGNDRALPQVSSHPVAQLPFKKQPPVILLVPSGQKELTTFVITITVAVSVIGCIVLFVYLIRLSRRTRQLKKD